MLNIFHASVGLASYAGSGGGNNIPNASATTGTCLDVPGTTAGTQARIWPCSGQPTQNSTYTTGNQLNVGGGTNGSSGPATARRTRSGCATPAAR